MKRRLLYCVLTALCRCHSTTRFFEIKNTFHCQFFEEPEQYLYVTTVR